MARREAPDQGVTLCDLLYTRRLQGQASTGCHGLPGASYNICFIEL